MLLKFKEPKTILQGFTHYAEVDESKIRRYVGPIAPIENVSFKISTPIHRDLQPYFNKTQDAWIMTVPYDFYFVDGNFIVILKDGETFILHHNITHFRIGATNQFVPIENMSFYVWCYFDYEKRLFIPIGGLHA